MNIRIAYYVVALAISLAAFTSAYGVAADANVRTAYAAQAAVDAADAYNAAARTATAARAATVAINAANAVAAAANVRTAYGMAVAVSLAAFAGAYILDKRRVPREG